MSVCFYFDHHIHWSIVEGLRKRRVDCLTASEDARADWDDERLLERATQLQRVIVSADRDMMAIANSFLSQGKIFHGLIRIRLIAITVGMAIDQLHLMADATMADEWLNQIRFLPM